MPIRKEMRGRYPRNWREIREAIRERAGDRCEKCGVPNHAIGYRDAAGEFVELPGMMAETAALDGIKTLQIVCTVAHVHDPAPENCDPENLAFWCQKCHLNHDRPHHNAVRKANALRRKAAGALPGLDLEAAS